jgi:hypothetical protein
LSVTGIGFAHEHQRGVAQLVEAGAHDLRLAAQAVRVLDAVVAVAVRVADGAAGEQRAVVAGDVDLARLPAQGVDARVERPVAAARRIDGERADDERRLEHGLEREERVQRQCGRDLRAVDERQPLLRGEAQRSDAGVGQRAAVQEGALADQRQRQVRQGREVARRADRALLGDGRHEPRGEHREQGLHHVRPDARGAAREAGRLGREDEPHHLGRQRRADADGVRADEVELQALEGVVVDAGRGELAEAGVDAIDGPAAGEGALDRGAAGADGLERGVVEGELPLAAMERLELLERQRARDDLHSIGIRSPCCRALAIAES